MDPVKCSKFNYMSDWSKYSQPNQIRLFSVDLLSENITEYKNHANIYKQMCRFLGCLVMTVLGLNSVGWTVTSGDELGQFHYQLPPGVACMFSTVRA